MFIFNHQSAVETLLLCKLLRRDFVGIAKKELQRSLLGPLFAASGTIFVDRFNHQQAVHALEPAIAALRRGISIVIAPEGTRSSTPRLGPFKKGAFHLAMAAKRPLVPIVFKNSLDVSKHGTILRPATVEVVVHKPIATTTGRGGRWSGTSRTCTSSSRRHLAPDPEPRNDTDPHHPWFLAFTTAATVPISPTS